MSELPDSPDLGIKWCPKCEPTRDPSREILEVQYCGKHYVDRTGSADDGVPGDISAFNLAAGNSESDGETNRLMSDLLKKGQKKKK